jgi:hypothetical protein
MNRIVSKALVRTGFSSRLPLDPCFTRVKGFPVAWKELEKQEGFDFHQACLLWQEGLLSWKPEPDMQVDPTQAAELRFVYGVRVRSMLPETLVKAMFQQLQKPYHYSHDCIYWDFGKGRWRYFPDKAALNVFEHPDNETDGNDNRDVLFDKPASLGNRKLPVTPYLPDRVYRVEVLPGNKLHFTLRKTRDTDLNHVVYLHPGDRVVFHP